ncbi:hypothetical protein ES705_11588 [subsurface metagenome]
MNKANPIIHNGCHIIDYKQYFEWWYFDFDLEGQYHIYIEWHAPNFTLRDESCLLIIRMHNKAKKQSEDSKIKTFRYHRSLITQKETSCDIVFPSGHITEKDDSYFINVNERDLLINLTLKRLSPPVIAEDEVLYCTKDGKEFFAWNVPIPRGEVTGEIELSDEQIDVHGTVYHDHNWGNLNIGKHLLGWIWLRILFDDFTLIFGDMTVKESSEKQQVLLLIDKDGKKIDISSLQVHYTDYKKHHNSSIPYSVQITCNNKKYRVHLSAEYILSTQEFPLGSFDKHLWNSCLAKTYYLLKMNNAPNFIKKWFGNSLYFQFLVKGKFYIDDELIDITNGKMEVFSFAN